MTPKKFFLLDAMALIYRAHFVFINNPRITTKGQNTSAIYGFMLTLLELLDKEQPTHLGVAFDTDAPTFRHEAYAEYKAQREEMPEDIRTAIPWIRKILDAYDIPILEVDGYEADDVIGTLALQAGAEGVEVYMMTPDKDYAQLVRNQVYLFRPGLGGKPSETLDADKVKEKFGVRPDQIADYLGLKGDSVDNIPGVPKIGDKTAVKLLEQFDTIENLLDRLDEVSAKGQRNTLEQHREQALQSKELATINTQAPIRFEPDRLELGDPNYEELGKLFAELEFRSLAKRVLGEAPEGLFAQADNNETNKRASAQANLEQADEYHSLQTTEHTYTLVDTPGQRSDLLKTLQQAEVFCFDTETTSLNPMNAELVGLSFAIQPGQAWFVPAPEERQAARELLQEFAPLFADENKTAIAQNAKYDLHVLANYGLAVHCRLGDTMLAHYVLDSSSKHGMDTLARSYLNYSPVSLESLIGKKGKNQKSVRDIEPATLADYAAEDADITLQLWNRFQQDLEQEDELRQLLERVDQPLVPVLLDMERNGVRINREFLDDYSLELKKELEQLELKAMQESDAEFNLNSPRQLGEVLFDKLQLGKGKKTKSGQYSTDEETLTKLAADTQHPLPQLVLEYRQLSKLKSTYVDALPDLINPRTGRVHTTYNQTVAITGRLSSNNPNLQNIPIRTDRGREVRKAFIASPGYTLFSADYSQVELRVMAAMSQDAAMLEAFQNGEDIHRATASRVFGVAPDQVDSEQRRRAKMVNFGIIYGITAYGLGQRLGIARGEAKDIIDTYFEQYPGIKQYMDRCIEEARERGYAKTLTGRRHYLPDLNSRNATIRGFAERNAINTPIQGAAADLMKLAMIRIHQRMQQENFRSLMLLQVHDELVFDALPEELDALRELVCQEMSSAMDLGVPLVVESGQGPNWLEAH